MNILNQGSKVPECFKIANQEIKVVIEESLNDSYGNFCDVTNVIKMARTINTENDGLIRLTDEQMKNTFYHELFHAFQFYFNNKFDEIQAQIYANFMCEYLESTDKPF